MQDEMLEQERETEEERLEEQEELSAVDQPEPEAEAEVSPVPRPERPRRKRRPSSLVLVLALCVGLLCGAVPTGWYFSTKLERLQTQMEENTVSKSTIENLVYQYGLTTTFLQQIFPQDYVYVGEHGIAIEPMNEALARHSYDWSGLGETNGRYTYIAPDGTQALLGVDVSTFSGEIDWAAVKNDGISFAMVRLGFRGYGESGKLVLDEQFLTNIQGATEAGLDVGVYFFSQAITVEEAEEEAEYVLKALEDYSISYPVVFDLENIDYDTARTDGLSVEMATQVTKAFCQKVEQAGYHPMIYGNVAWLMDRLDLTQLTEYDLWLAQYQKTPTFPYQFRMWQYSNQGKVAGIEGSVDMNLLLAPFS